MSRIYSIMNVGYKIPPAEVLHRINGSANKANLKRNLRSGSHGSRTSSSTTNNFSYKTAPSGLLREPDPTDDSNDCRQTSSGLLREPDSADNFDLKRTPPGLLREPGSALGINCW